MIIELYQGYADYRWSTFNVDIPDNTPEDKIEEVARKVGQSIIDKEQRADGYETVFIGLYCIINPEDE